MPPLIDFVCSISAEIEVDIYTLYYPFHTHNFRLFRAQVHSFDLGRHTPWLRKFHSGQIKKRPQKNMPRGLMILFTRFGRINRQPLLAEGVHWHVIGPDAGDPVVRNWLSTQAIDLPVTLRDRKPHWEDEANRQRNWVQSNATLAIAAERFKTIYE